MTLVRPRHVGVFMCIWLACLVVLTQTVLADIPMKTIPVHLMSRSDAGRKQILLKFQPKNVTRLRYIEHGKTRSSHHVDMFVELKTDDGNRTIQSLNPFAFQHAVKSISCSRSRKRVLKIKLSSEYAKQVLRWKIPTRKVFAIVIPHDFVDLKKNAACYTELSVDARNATRDHPMEAVVKLVKTPRFLDAKNPNILTMTIVKTNIWSEMSRAQSVEIYHRPIDERVSGGLHKRFIAEQDGPTWNYESDLTAATQNITGDMPAKNVNVDLDKSTAKGDAQAAMAWSQTCIRGTGVGIADCVNWSITKSQISGTTEVSHEAQVSVKADSGNTTVENPATDNPDEMLTLTKVDIMTPSIDLIKLPIPLIGFRVPGVFTLGGTISLELSVFIKILVQATKDIVVSTGSSASCPWVIEWNGTFAEAPNIQFGNCSLPGTPKFISDLGGISNRKPSETTVYLGNNTVSNPSNGTALNPDDRVVPPPVNTPIGGNDTAPNPENTTVSRQTVFVGVGLQIAPFVGLEFSLFINRNLAALSAGFSAPIKLSINTNWDTQNTTKCPANHVELYAEGSSALHLQGAFFAFSDSIPIVEGPTLTTPSACIPK
ncbi:hypothetical protein BGX27_009092 [Mortierella sp. AM989]|nr:hypothetical protein BGX27_009092 [Mortierella sp. AM989]